jgi:hypothetical protein
MPLISGSSEELQRFLQVLLHALTVLVHLRQMHLSLRVPCFCCCCVQTCSQRMVCRHPFSLFVHAAEGNEGSGCPLQRR